MAYVLQILRELKPITAKHDALLAHFIELAFPPGFADGQYTSPCNAVPPQGKFSFLLKLKALDFHRPMRVALSKVGGDNNVSHIACWLETLLDQ